jgi:single-stranded-DNA-specific exonuclease
VWQHADPEGLLEGWLGDARRLPRDHVLVAWSTADRIDEVTRDHERLSRHIEPCGTGNPSPVFGVRGVRFAGWSVLRNGHLKGILDDGRARVAAIGFQLADRVPWLGEGLVDAAFRIECNEWQGQTTLQARLCALTPASAV